MQERIDCICTGACPKCGDDIKRVRQQVTVTLRRENLIYDIRNCAYIESHTLAEDAGHVRHLVADIGEEGNIDRVDRVMALAFSLLVQRLGEWTRTDLDTGLKEIDDDRWIPCEYRVKVCLPRKNNATTVALLGHLMHQYVVTKVLYDWLLTAVPKSAEAWAARLAEIEDELERVTNSTDLCFRRHTSPW